MASRDLFRQSAVAFHANRGLKGDVLHLTDGVLVWTHWLLLLVVITTIFFAWTGEVDEYASGPAVVRLEGRTEITAPRAAVVESVEVVPGDRVQAGDLLVRMHSAAQTAELESVKRELEDQLAKRLRDPTDAVARQAIVSLRSRRDLASASLERQSIRAPSAATVGDVRVRAGQLLEPGMPVLTLVSGQASTRVIVMLPGHYLPLLEPGQVMRFRIDGFAREVHALTIQRVADQIIGPAEAARYLGRDLGDAFPIRGPVVLVHAQLASNDFESEGERYSYYHGMHGRAETAVRRDNLAFTFIPGLRQVVDNVW